MRAVLDRAAVFIDGAYLDKAREHLGNPRLDYRILSDKVCGQVERFRTYYYHCLPFQATPPTRDQSERYSAMDRFVASLRRLPRFEVRLGRLQFVDGVYRQKGVDTLLTLDLAELAGTGPISHAVVITADSDLVPVFRRARDRGILVSLSYLPGTGVHTELLEACDDRTPLSQEFLQDCLRA